MNAKVVKAALEQPKGRVVGRYDPESGFLLWEEPTVTGGTLAAPRYRGRTRILEGCTALAERNPKAVLEHLFRSGASVDGSTVWVLQLIADGE